MNAFRGRPGFTVREHAIRGMPAERSDNGVRDGGGESASAAGGDDDEFAARAGTAIRHGRRVSRSVEHPLPKDTPGASVERTDAAIVRAGDERRFP